MEEDITCGTRLDHFAESEELSAIVSRLPDVCGEMRPSENAVEKFTGATKLCTLHVAYYHRLYCRHTGPVPGAASPPGPIPRSEGLCSPYLLRPYPFVDVHSLHTESLIAKLFSLAQLEAPPSLMHLCFKLLYLISKVRGAKVVVRWFSHEVADLQPVLQLLQKQDIQDYQACQSSLTCFVVTASLPVRRGKHVTSSSSGSPSSL